MAGLIAVNHPNPNKGLISESQVKANQQFTSGYDCFMRFIYISVLLYFLLYT
jgi:hypothetical protein